MSTKKKKDKLNMDAEEMACQEEQTAEPEPELETEEMDAKLADLEKECAEWKDKYLRSMAEFENYRRRSIQEKSDWIKLSTQKLALEICDVSDNFERALQHVSACGFQPQAAQRRASRRRRFRLVKSGFPPARE